VVEDESKSVGNRIGSPGKRLDLRLSDRERVIDQCFALGEKGAERVSERIVTQSQSTSNGVNAAMVKHVIN